MKLSPFSFRFIVSSSALASAWMPTKFNVATNPYLSSSITTNRKRYHYNSCFSSSSSPWHYHRQNTNHFIWDKSAATARPERKFYSKKSSDDDNTNLSTGDDDDHETQLETLSKKLSNGEFKNVIVVLGAGASVSAGIPDFRSPGTGLYDRLQKHRLPYPEAIFDLDYYRDRPEPFVELCQSIWPGQEGMVFSTLAWGEKKQRIYSF
jgi:hypothetical protein